MNVARAHQTAAVTAIRAVGKPVTVDGREYRGLVPDELSTETGAETRIGVMHPDEPEWEKGKTQAEVNGIAYTVLDWSHQSEMLIVTLEYTGK